MGQDRSGGWCPKSCFTLSPSLRHAHTLQNVRQAGRRQWRQGAGTPPTPTIQHYLIHSTHNGSMQTLISSHSVSCPSPPLIPHPDDIVADSALPAWQLLYTSCPPSFSSYMEQTVMTGFLECGWSVEWVMMDDGQDDGFRIRSETEGVTWKQTAACAFLTSPSHSPFPQSLPLFRCAWRGATHCMVLARQQLHSVGLRPLSLLLRRIISLEEKATRDETVQRGWLCTLRFATAAYVPLYMCMQHALPCADQPACMSI